MKELYDDDYNPVKHEGGGECIYSEGGGGAISTEGVGEG